MRLVPTPKRPLPRQAQPGSPRRARRCGARRHPTAGWRRPPRGRAGTARANLPPRGFGPGRDEAPSGWRHRDRHEPLPLSCAHYRSVDGGRRPLYRFLLPLSPVCVCRFLGQLFRAGRGRLQLCCPVVPRLGRFGKAAQRAWAARAGMRRLRGKNGHARSKADNRLGRQYGSLFPTPLHSTVWATKKNWTRQRRK